MSNNKLSIFKKIFNKIQNFINIYFFKKNLLEEKQPQNFLKNKADFVNSIKTNEDSNIKTLELQRSFEQGHIEEKDLSREDVEKLHKLYNEQIRKIKNETKKLKKVV